MSGAGQGPGNIGVQHTNVLNTLLVIYPINSQVPFKSDPIFDFFFFNIEWEVPGATEGKFILVVYFRSLHYRAYFMSHLTPYGFCIMKIWSDQHWITKRQELDISANWQLHL